MEDTEKNVLHVDVAHQQDENYIPPVQSANTLFRFFKKSDYLYSALRNKALIPRFYAENVDYLSIGCHQIAYPMVCFCDINIHRLSNHLVTYGGYGIAFSKRWGIHQGIQPLQYVNYHSILCKDFSTAFTSAMQAEQTIPAIDYLLTQMFYLKPIEGIMPRDGKEISKNFTDECEWRFIPDISQIGLPSAVTDDNMASIGVLNKTIADNECCWLKFSPSDIKYIILKNEDDFMDLCKIINEITDDDAVRKKLISQVLIWENVKEDF